MMMKNLSRCVGTMVVAVGLVTTAPAATVVMQALSSFGGGDGWLAPAESPPDMSASVLTTGSTERGIAYSPLSNHLYVASRSSANAIYILDALTGNQLGTLNADSTVVTGGAFPINMVRVAQDGAIYVCNLTDNTASASKPFKIYRWLDEVSAPELVFSGDGGLVTLGTRLGDTMDVIGSGANTRIVAGYGNTTTVVGEENGYYLIRPDVVNPAASAVQVTGTGDGDFRSGITFLDESTVWGDSGSSNVRRTRYTGTIGTAVTGSLEGTLSLTSTNERPLDYAVINGVPLLATVESSTGNKVHIYDVSDPTVRLELASLDLTTLFTTNSNGVGSITWGNISGNTATLYAMNTNNGIQAFSLVVIPEAGIGMLSSSGLLCVAMQRRRRSQD